MTRDEIIKLARKAGFRTGSYTLSNGEGCVFAHPVSFSDCIPELERFAALVAAAEREAIESALTDPENQPSQWGTVTIEHMEQQVAAEREACAKVCSGRAMKCESEAQRAIENGEHDEVSAIRSTAWQISVCAAAIRTRSKE